MKCFYPTILLTTVTFNSKEFTQIKLQIFSQAIQQDHHVRYDQFKLSNFQTQKSTEIVHEDPVAC